MVLREKINENVLGAGSNTRNSAGRWILKNNLSIVGCRYFHEHK
jgi:hypothetical protein